MATSRLPTREGRRIYLVLRLFEIAPSRPSPRGGIFVGAAGRRWAEFRLEIEL